MSHSLLHARPVSSPQVAPIWSSQSRAWRPARKLQPQKARGEDRCNAPIRRPLHSMHRASNTHAAPQKLPGAASFISLRCHLQQRRLFHALAERSDSISVEQQSLSTKEDEEVVARDISPMEVASFERPVDGAAYPDLAKQREESLRMVDLYDDFRDPNDSIMAPRTSTAVLLDEDRPLRPPVLLDPGPQQLELVSELEDAINSRGASVRDVYKLYSQLPQPGVRYLGSAGTTKLLSRLRRLKMADRDQVAMLQYLSVFDDMHAAGLRPSADQWATAMHLTGRYSRQVTMAELDHTMRIWRRMEREAGIPSDTTTMNILLDVASKSGHYTLAEFVLREMHTRHLRFDRYTRLGIIYLHGCKEDGEGVRSAYKDFVNADEVVDGMALTCVITSLLKAGELPAAMNVYQRMLSKTLPQDRDQSSPESVRNLGRIITRYSRAYSGNAAMIEKLQSGLSLAPNLITYIGLIRFHAQKTGELVPVGKLLDEMHASGVPLHGQIFIELFRGFARHGNQLYTSWTPQRLQDVYGAFIELVDARTPNVFVGPITAGAVVNAFARCHGRRRAREVIPDLKLRWRKTRVHQDDMDEELLERIASSGKMQ